MTHSEKYKIYNEMFQNCENIEQQIREHAANKGHQMLSKCTDVFVGDEETRAYFIDFEAKNKSGNYYRVRGIYSVEEMKKSGIIA